MSLNDNDNDTAPEDHMSHDITLNGSLISATFEVATAVSVALEQSARDYPGRLIHVHGIDGESVLAEVRDGVLVSLTPGTLVTSVFFPEVQGEVIVPTEDHLARTKHLTEEMRTKIACVRWEETPTDPEIITWAALADLCVKGFIELVAV